MSENEQINDIDRELIDREYIEIQKESSDNIPKRARYHSAIPDTHGGLKRGKSFDELIDSIGDHYSELQFHGRASVKSADRGPQ